MMYQPNYQTFVLILLCSMLIIAYGCGESESPITTDKDTIDRGTTDVIDEQPSLVGTARVRGLLVDQATKQTLRNTRVKLVDSKGETRAVLTTRAGVFEFEGLPAGEKFTVIVELDGYEKHESIVTPIETDETATITVNLVPVVKEDQLPPGDGLSLGAKAPDFELKDGDGKAHSLADYAGEQRVVLLFDRGAW